MKTTRYCGEFLPEKKIVRLKVINFGKMVFAKLKNFFAKLIFFPPNFFFAQKDFPFPKYRKKFWREKNQLSKKAF
jgi:hypothetical protein